MPRRRSGGDAISSALALACLPVAAALALWLISPLALLLVFAPLVEEWVFRVGLQEALLRRVKPAFVANLVATLAFVVLHGLTRSWWLAAWVVLPSLVLGALYQRSRRAWPVVLAHAAMNLVWVALHAASPGPFLPHP